VVTGGYVYRGPDPSLQGKYFFLDSRNSVSPGDDNYWMFDPANPTGTVMNIDSLLVPNAGAPQFPVSFGEDALGRLYIAYLISGDVYRITMAGDYDSDDVVDAADFDTWRAAFGTTGTGVNPPADGNRNRSVDAADYVVWRKNLAAPAGSAAGDALHVPEPASPVLVGFCVCIGILMRPPKLRNQ
jgi:hypothetical protein